MYFTSLFYKTKPITLKEQFVHSAAPRIECVFFQCARRNQFLCVRIASNEQICFARVELTASNNQNATNGQITANELFTISLSQPTATSRFMIADVCFISLRTTLTIARSPPPHTHKLMRKSRPLPGILQISKTHAQYADELPSRSCRLAKLYRARKLLGVQLCQQLNFAGIWRGVCALPGLSPCCCCCWQWERWNILLHSAAREKKVCEV